MDLILFRTVRQVLYGGQVTEDASARGIVNNDKTAESSRNEQNGSVPPWFCLSGMFRKQWAGIKRSSSGHQKKL